MRDFVSDLQPNLKFDHAYAIVRVDQPHHKEVRPDESITVVKVVHSEATAKAEVARLTALNGAKGSRYFWQITRIERMASSESS